MSARLLWFWTAAAALLLGQATVASAGGPPRCNPSAQQAFDAGRFETARHGFERGLAEAQKAHDRTGTSACAFYLGLVAHDEASAAEGNLRDELLAKAEAWYRLARHWDKSAPGPIINLARVYEEMGQLRKAAALLEEAVASVSQNDQAPFFRAYADVLAQQNRPEEAAEYYRKALDVASADQPVDLQARLALFDLLLRHSPALLVDEVWKALEDDQTVSAQEAAFKALSLSLGLPAEKRVSLLTAIVAAMARQPYEPEHFRSSDTGRKLQELKKDPLLGKGVRQIFALDAREALSSPAAYDWWSEISPSPRSPLVAFRALIRSLALKADTNTGTARSYLKLGERLQPRVPDVLIYGELASIYAAHMDTRRLLSELDGWEDLLKEVLAAREAKTPPLDPKDIAIYHLKAAAALERVGIEPAKGSEPTSIEYHLMQAQEHSEHAKQAGLLLSVGAAQERNGFSARETYESALFIANRFRDEPGMPEAGAEATARLRKLRVPEPGGGGGGDGDRWATLNSWTGFCVGYPEQTCRKFSVELRELVPRSPDRWAAGGVRRIRAGCVEAKGIARAEAGLEPKALQASLGPTFSGMSRALSRSACRRVSLNPVPSWLTSGAWSGADLLLADSLHARLLRYDLEGSLRQVLPASSSLPEKEPRISQVLSTPDGKLAVVQDGERLIWLDERQGLVARHSELTGRRGSQGTLQAVYQLTLAGPDEAFVVGDLERTDGSWTRGVVRVPMHPGGEPEVVHRIAPLDPNFDLYRVGNPYLASVAGRTYFLDLREPVSLNVLPAGKEPKRLLMVLPHSSGSGRPLRRTDLGEPEATAALYRAIEELSLPAGLFGFKDFLYLLTRRPAEEGKTIWTLARFDPENGRELHSIPLPTSAAHLTVVPGERHWALVEKGRVEGWGKQSIATAVFVPSSWIEGSIKAIPQDCGSGSEIAITH